MTQLRKTPAGQNEVTAKSHALPPRARSLLIMIDGKRSLADLRAMLGATVDESAELLLREGLVEAPQVVAPVPAPASASGLAPQAVVAGPEPVPAAAVSEAALPRPVAAPSMAPPPLDWQQMRQEAARAVYDALGPLGQELSLRLERCRNVEELLPTLRRAADLLDIGASVEQAANFRQRFLPPG